MYTLDGIQFETNWTVFSQALRCIHRGTIDIGGFPISMGEYWDLGRAVGVKLIEDIGCDITDDRWRYCYSVLFIIFVNQ